MIKRLVENVIGAFLLLSPGLVVGQDPVDCVNAVVVCDNQQLNYNSNGSGINDFDQGPNDNSNGCLSSDEHQSAWFQIYISPSSPPGATLAFTLNPTGGQGQDYDFALYGPNVPCENLGNPIRCSYAASSCFFCPETGLGMGTTDFSESFDGDGFVAEVQTQPGQSYLLLIDNWSSSNQGFYLDWTGTAVLSCSCSTMPVISGNNQICPGETSVLTATGTNLSTYTWTASAGGAISGPTNNSSVNATSAGSYTVSVTDADGCIGSASYVITVSNGAGITYTITPSTCGLSNGSIDVTVTGTGPFSYDWSNNATTQDLATIAAGSYTITVEDGNGCTSSATIVVVDQNQALNVMGVVTNNTSCVQDNGSISVSVNPPGTYIYTWSNGGTTPSITNLATGTYSITVTSNGSCTGTATFTVVDAAVEPTINSAVTQSTCELPNGAINVSVSGGVSPYTFSWSSGQTTEDLTNVSPGSYSVTVTGVNGCTASSNVTVTNNNPNITVTGIVTPNTSCNTPNGSITVTINPATSPSGQPYTFSWSSGETVQNLDNLSAGTFSIVVNAGGSCSGTAVFTIADQPIVPDINETITPEECGGSDGAIVLNISGGQSPFTYLWSDGSTGSGINNLTAGNYSVTVTGSNGCTAEEAINVPNNQITFVVTPAIQPNTTCSNNYNGSISINVSPTGSYTYLWSNGENTQNIFDLSPGNYTLTISSGMCEQQFDFVVPNEPLLPTFTITSTASICGEANGSATLTMTGGGSPYTFLWSNGANTQNLQNVIPGNYAITVTGANECEATGNVTINNSQINITATGSVTPNTSCLNGNGSVTLNVTPLNGLTFDWSNGASAQNINNVSSGQYSVTISANSDCQSTFTFNVPDAIVTPLINLTAVSATCGQSNGSVNLSMNTGTAPFEYDWSGGASTEDLTSVEAGIYSVTVTDALGCTASSSIIVNDNIVPLIMTSEIIDNTSCDFPNGTIDIEVSPPGIYQYTWSSGEDSEDLYGIDPGTYTLTVSLGACIATSSFTVDENISAPVVEANVTPAICSESNGAINLSVSGAVPPYSFDWSTGENSQDITDLFPGNYTVTVTDANDCSTILDVNVTNNSSSFSLSGTVAHVTSCIQANGQINLTIDPPGSYDILWSTGETSDDITGLVSGDYTVTVSLAGSCNGSATFSIEDQTSLPSYNAQLGFDECDQGTGSIEIVNVNGDGPFTYLWSNGENTSTIDNLLAGNYSVTVTDKNGCAATSSHVISSTNTDISIVTSSTPNTVCTSPNGSIHISVTPAGDYAIEWSNGETTEDLSGLSSGNYTVTVSIGSCNATATVFVGADASAISLNSAVSNVSCFGSTDGYIHLETGGGYAPFTYAWDPPIAGSIEDLNNLGAGQYTVTVTDQAGCAMTSSFTITQPDALYLSCSQSQNVSVPGGSDAVASVLISGGTSPYSITWSPGSSQSGLVTGIFNINNLSEGSYTVDVTDANGCTAVCLLSITSEDCTTATGTMDPGDIVVCGEGCATGLYDASGEVLNTNDIIQFILHTGPGQLIQNEIARAGQPEFCFDASLMAYNVQYYMSAVAGTDDGNGNVLLTSPCSKINAGTPVIFREVPRASIDDPEMIDCDNPEVELTGHATITESSYLWTTKTGNILGDPKQATIIVNQAGLYELIVTALTCSDTAGVQVNTSDDYPSLTINPADDLNCKDTEVTLTGFAQQPGVLLQWAVMSNNDTNFIATGTSITINAPGEYHLIGTAGNGCRSSTSVSVNQFINVPTVVAGADLTLNCDQSPVTIQANASANVDYQWNSPSGIQFPFDNQSTVTIDQPGMYVIIVTDSSSFCTASDTVEVFQNNEAPISQVGVQHVSCFGETDGMINVQPTQGTSPFAITINGADYGTNGLFSGLSAGLYDIEVVDAGGCKWLTQIEIIVPDVLVVDLGVDISVQPGESISLEAITNITPSAIESITWEPDYLNDCPGDPCSTLVHSFISSTQVAVTLMDTNGCIAQDQLSVNVVDERNIFIPNTFSPNDDGVNDIMFISANESQIKSIKSFTIYNRWGNEMYEASNFAPNDPAMGWDGTFKNLKVNPGVFVYRAEIEFINGDLEVIAGDVTVVR